MLHGAEQTGLADVIRGRCTDVFRRTTVSVVLGRVQLPAVRYCNSWARAGSNCSPSRACCGRYDGVPESHVGSGQMGVANAMPGPGSENAMLGRRQIVQIHRQTSRLQGDAFLFCLGGEEIRMNMPLRAFGDTWLVTFPGLTRVG